MTLRSPSPGCEQASKRRLNAVHIIQGAFDYVVGLEGIHRLHHGEDFLGGFQLANGFARFAGLFVQVIIHPGTKPRRCR